LRIPAAEIEHLVTSRVRQWLLDPGIIYQSTRLADPSAQRRLIARAVEIGKNWTELSGTLSAGGRWIRTLGPRRRDDRGLWLGNQHHRAASVGAELLYVGKSAPYGGTRF